MSLEKTPRKSPQLMTPPDTLRGRKMIVDVSVDQLGQQHYSLLQSSPPPTISRNPRLAPGDTTLDNSSRQLPPYIQSAQTVTLESAPVNSTPESGDKIWSADVENAFTEALSIIPKKGLYKVKISGCSRGRNELVSDYIMAKTGKLRSRKQVSSHIQVIKNLRKDPALVDLILHGPEPTDQAAARFDKVFSEISLQKSLGSTGSVIINTPTRHRKRPRVDVPQGDIGITVRRFKFNYVNTDEPQLSHSFSILSDDPLRPPLRIRTNADLSFRFPRFFELVESLPSKVPILHSMVKMTVPTMSRGMYDGQFSVGSLVKLTNVPRQDKHLCCLTLIYSFGRMILTTFEQLETKSSTKSGNSITAEVRLGTDYWRDFFAGLRRLVINKLTDKSEDRLVSRAVKGVTVKQVLFAVDKFDGVYDLDTIPRESIRSIMLWEFVKVDTPDQAQTTLRAIHLPNRHAVPPKIPRSSTPIKERRGITGLSLPCIPTVAKDNYVPEKRSQSTPNLEMFQTRDLDKDLGIDLPTDLMMPMDLNLEKNEDGSSVFDGLPGFMW